ncbi:hypothetical protein TcG_02591 [Trypanosoma cruzi]|nr:hypothetical protein BCY84_20726 [Trypanosoma cruzi cruzi]RNF21848.1 hypothetical protein TcG_02591 [Trypanosoma cruzi]
MMRRWILWEHTLLTVFFLLLLSGWGVDAWNVGEIIPVTLHMRLKRAAPTTTVGRNDMEELEDMQESGQGEQFLRPLPPDFCPRFGINRRVHQPAKRLFEHAHKQTQASGRSLSDVAVRFQLERGLSKSTAWLPLLKTTVRSSMSNRGQNASVRDENMLYLAAVTFSFGYQESTFNKITTFYAEPVYAPVHHEEIELQYHWEERRAYNPHKALSACAFISVFATIAVLYMIIFSSRSLSKEIKNKTFTLRSHRE